METWWRRRFNTKRRRLLTAYGLFSYCSSNAVEDRDLLLLMTDGAWTHFSLYLLAQTVMKSLMNLPELPDSILRQAAKGGVCDDMTVAAILVRSQETNQK